MRLIENNAQNLRIVVFAGDNLAVSTIQYLHHTGQLCGVVVPAQPEPYFQQLVQWLGQMNIAFTFFDDKQWQSDIEGCNQTTALIFRLMCMYLAKI